MGQTQLDDDKIILCRIMNHTGRKLVKHFKNETSPNISFFAMFALLSSNTAWTPQAVNLAS